jgi:hypothetical protein
MNAFKKTIILAIGVFSTATSGLLAHSDAFKPEFVDTLVAPYLQIQAGLAGDDLTTAKSGANAYLAAMKSAPEGEADEESSDLRTPAEKIAAAANIEAARAAFLTLSNELTSLVKHVGTTGSTALFVAHCPMAFGGKGGDWIQADKTVSNPYYGSRMLRCGGIKEQVSGDEEPDHTDHRPSKHNTPHTHGSVDHNKGDNPYSVANLDAVHAGVPGYLSTAGTPVASTGSTSGESSACGMACCADVN